MKNTLKATHEEFGVDRVGEENIAESASQVGIGVIMTLAALIGVWGLACLVVPPLRRCSAEIDVLGEDWAGLGYVVAG